MGFETPIQLLTQAARHYPDEPIMQVYEVYRLHRTTEPGVMEKMPGSAYDAAIAALDAKGWLNEHGQLFIPEDFYNRVSRELPEDFTAFLETYRPKPNPSQYEVLGYYCSMYTWGAKRGML